MFMMRSVHSQAPSAQNKFNRFTPSFNLMAMALIALSTSGCMFSPYGGGYGGGYGGYPSGGGYGYPSGGGYGGYPGYSQPIQTLQPGGTYLPGGTVYPNSTIPGSTYPGSTYPGTTYPGTTNPGTGGGLQPIPSTSLPGNSVSVPDPYMSTPSAANPNSTSSLRPSNSDVQPANHQQPNSLQPISEPNPPAQTFTPMNPTPMNPIVAEPTFQTPVAAEPAPAYSPPPQQSGGFDFDAPAASSTPVPTAAGDPFETPIQPLAPSQEAPTQAGPQDATPLFELNKVTPSELAPFGRDEKLRWVRGVVSKEPTNGTWSIIFDDNPQSNDPLAGHLTIAPSPHLEQLKDGDVVEIQGQVDTIAKDRLGKPVYLVNSVTKLVEKSENVAVENQPATE